MKKRGFVVTFASPSGGGKSTICNEVLKINPLFCYSISWTTRELRGDEVNGKDYFFIDIETFKQKIDEDFFLEYAEVHGNFYGTSREFITDCIEKEKIVLLDIDVQGVELLKKQGIDVVTIFILPPSERILEDRLVKRGTDTTEVINKRLENAKKEIEYLQGYDYLVINDNIQDAINTVNCILIAETNKQKRYIDPVKEYYRS